MNAVVFDCDGVLVDSEALSEDAWNLVLSRYGVHATVDDAVAVRGTSNRDTYAHFSSRGDLPVFDDFLSQVQPVLRGLFESGLTAFDDAVATVRELALYGVPMAVASSSDRVNLDYKLARFDLARYFDAVVSGDEVSRGKPAPDVYLAAAAGLGMAPHDCLAIEDAELGARAATAAGMRVVTVTRYEAPVPGFAAVDRLDAAEISAWLGTA